MEERKTTWTIILSAMMLMAAMYLGAPSVGCGLERDGMCVTGCTSTFTEFPDAGGSSASGGGGNTSVGGGGNGGTTVTGGGGTGGSPTCDADHKLCGNQ